MAHPGQAPLPASPQWCRLAVPKPLCGSLPLLSLRAPPGEAPSAGFRVWPGSAPVIASPWEGGGGVGKAEAATGHALMQTPTSLWPGPRGRREGRLAEQVFCP